jgi:hypothetical protein
MPYGNLNFKLNDQRTSKKSSGRLRGRQWNYVSLNLVEGKLVQLYLNSKLDFELLVQDDQQFPFAPQDASRTLYIGGDPWHDSADYKAYIDDLLITG